MSPNVVRVITALGLRDALGKVAFQAENIAGRDWSTGRVLYRTPLKEEIRKAYGADYVHAHRADLHAVLLAAAGDARIELGRRCVGVRHAGASAAVRFEDGSETEADVVIGADGIHSGIRANLFGPEAPKFTGNMCWRTLVPADLVRDIVRPDVSVWQGPA